MKNLLLIPLLALLAGCGPGGDNPLMTGKLKGASCYETINCAVIIEDQTSIKSFKTGKVDYSSLIGKHVGIIKTVSDYHQVIEM
jgi:hypothetical protein